MVGRPEPSSPARGVIEAFEPKQAVVASSEKRSLLDGIESN
ncbi:MAG: hypothetical protein ACRDJP_00400 [Actinomycetota bacterium]